MAKAIFYNDIYNPTLYDYKKIIARGDLRIRKNYYLCTRKQNVEGFELIATTIKKC